MDLFIKSSLVIFVIILTVFPLLPNFAFAYTCAENALFCRQPGADFSPEYKSRCETYQAVCGSPSFEPEMGAQLTPEEQDKLFQKSAGGGAGGTLIGEQTGVGGTRVPSGSSQKISILNPLGVSTFAGLIAKINQWLIYIGGPILTLVILIGAFQLMTSGGSPEKVTKGRHTITYAVIGYALLLISTGIIFIIRDVLGG